MITLVLHYTNYTNQQYSYVACHVTYRGATISARTGRAWVTNVSLKQTKISNISYMKCFVSLTIDW